MCARAGGARIERYEESFIINHNFLESRRPHRPPHWWVVPGGAEKRQSRYRRGLGSTNQQAHPSDIFFTQFSRLGPGVLEHEDLARSVARDVDLVTVHKDCRNSSTTEKIDANSLYDVP